MTTTTAITCSRRALVAAGALSVAALLAPARAALASGRGREGDSILSASHERGTLVEAAGLALTLPGSVEEGGADSWVVTRGRTSVEVSILSYLDYAGLLALSGEAASEGRDFEADVRAFVSTAEREGAWVESATRLNVEGLDADAFQLFGICMERGGETQEGDLLFARDGDVPIAVVALSHDGGQQGAELVDEICLSAEVGWGHRVEKEGLSLVLRGSVEEQEDDYLGRLYSVEYGGARVTVAIDSYAEFVDGYIGRIGVHGGAAAGGHDFEADALALADSLGEDGGRRVEPPTRLDVEGLDADAFQAFVIRWEDEALGAGEWDLLFARDADGPVAVAQFYLYDDLDGARRLVDGICQSAELV